MQLQCKVCGAPIRAEDIHEELAIAKCSHCRAVLDLSGRSMRPVPPSREPGGRRQRPEVPVPERFEVSRNSGLHIRWPWRSAMYVALLGFCVLWDGFLVVWYAIALGSGEIGMAVFPVLHVAIGVVVTYSAVAGLLNRTDVEVSTGRLAIRHGPLPWPGQRALQATQIEQLFSMERVHTGKNGHRSYTYEVHAVLRPDKRELKLLTRLQRPEQALFLEQEIERYLRIKDEPIGGELPRTG